MEQSWRLEYYLLDYLLDLGTGGVCHQIMATVKGRAPSLNSLNYITHIHLKPLISRGPGPGPNPDMSALVWC